MSKSTNGYQSIRNSVGCIDTDEFNSVIEISGSSAPQFLDRILPGKTVFLQSFSALITPVLDSDLKIQDLVHVLNRDGSYFLLVSKSSKERTLSFLTQNLQEFTSEVQIRDLENEWSTVLIEGPQSWRLAKEIVGAEVIGLRIHAFLEFNFQNQTALCMRSGVAGEYGFRFMVKREDKAALSVALLQHRDYAAVAVTTKDLETLPLETRMPFLGAWLKVGDCPFESGLRYMLDFRKEEYVFHAALMVKKTKIEKETVGIVFDGLEQENAAIADLCNKCIFSGTVPVGFLKSVRFSPTLGKYLGYASLTADMAYPGIENLSMKSEQLGDVVLRTTLTPFFSTQSASIAME